MNLPNASKRGFSAAPSAAIWLALLLGACQHNEPDFYTGSVTPDYRDRHPIRLVDGQRSIQILVGSGRAGLTALRGPTVRPLKANRPVINTDHSSVASAKCVCTTAAKGRYRALFMDA